ncbi:MAG TPA: 4Fe-4S dicluster domain-containing protein [Dehalococcoidia bacterium]|nr:4Fe-4S dicluster domain-containing protein [Dehalococcoidia bacterium]
MAITFKHLFRPPITVQYPEEKLVVSRRIRGNELVWFPDRCTGCATCAKSCPQGNIEIATHVGSENNYVVDKFELDAGRCMFCGLCVESCPYEALAMGVSYEQAQYRRGDLVWSKEELQPLNKRPSGYARPEIEAALPKQSLLIYGDKERDEGGQKLRLIPLSKKRGRGV